MAATMKFTIIRKGSLSLFSWLLSCVVAYVMDLTPLCGTIDSEGRDEHKIYFKDGDHGIRTVEMNGTIIGCYPNAFVDDNVRFGGAAAAEPLPSVSMISFSPNINKCSGSYETFCSSGDNYPIDYIKFLLHKHWHMLSFAFHNDAIDSDEFILDGVIETETDICKSHEEIVYPTSGKNIDGKNLYIINTPEHQQGVRISVCREKNRPCRAFEKIPYQTKCEQRYIFREFLTLSAKGVPIKEKFKFPAFCTCKIYYDYK